MIRRMRRMNESKIRRPSAVEDMMDDIDFVYGSNVLGVKPSRIADILGKKLGQALQDVMGTKQKYQMMQRKNDSGGEYYGVMRSARANGCPLYYIVEHGFHSNKATCNWLLKDENLEKMVKAEVEVIAKHFGLKKKTTTTTTTSTTSKE